MPCGLWDPSSPTRDQTCATCIGSKESQPLEVLRSQKLGGTRLRISQRSQIFHLLFAQMMYLNIATARSFLQITSLLLLWISQLATSASVEALLGNL